MGKFVHRSETEVPTRRTHPGPRPSGQGLFLLGFILFGNLCVVIAAAPSAYGTFCAPLPLVQGPLLSTKIQLLRTWVKTFACSGAPISIACKDEGVDTLTISGALNPFADNGPDGGCILDYGLPTSDLNVGVLHNRILTFWCPQTSPISTITENGGIGTNALATIDSDPNGARTGLLMVGTSSPAGRLLMAASTAAIPPAETAIIQLRSALG